MGALFQLLRRRAERRALILLSNTTVVDDAEADDVVGVLSVPRARRGEMTYAIVTDEDSKFAIDGDELKLADTVDNGTSAAHAVTVSADNGIDPVRERRFVISVEAA